MNDTLAASAESTAGKRRRVRIAEVSIKTQRLFGVGNRRGLRNRIGGAGGKKVAWKPARFNEPAEPLEKRTSGLSRGNAGVDSGRRRSATEALAVYGRRSLREGV